MGLFSLFSPRALKQRNLILVKKQAPIKNATGGFTMVELLVVLVITGMTTSLLVTGLGTTWQNFDRLSNKNISQSQGQLPKSWFIKSVNAALLGHPDKPMFSGTASEFTFTTFLTPNDKLQRPQQITWRLSNNSRGSDLSFVYSPFVEEDPNRESTNSPQTVSVWQFSSQDGFTFEYLVSGAWANVFTPEKGELPTAIRIRNNTQIWTLATVHRPTLADMPPEIPLFGEYEF